MTAVILVTGATGNVGGQVAAQLAEAGAPVRALVRDPAKARLPGGVEAVAGDLGDTASLRAALGGVGSVFLMWPLEGTGAARAAVATLAEHARRVVYLSAWGVPEGLTGTDTTEPEPGIIGNHTTLERLVRGSGAEWTLLRPGGFAANTLGWAPQVRAGEVVRMASPRAGRSLIHEADIAAVAVRALLTDELVGTAPTMSGPEVLTQAEQVRIIGEVLGRPLKAEELPRDEAHAELVATGLPPHYATGILDAHARMEAEPETVAPGFEALAGRPGRTYRDWVADHAEDFRRPHGG